MTDPKIHKTFKLYIDGAFPRSESGRVAPLHTQRARKGARANNARAKNGEVSSEVPIAQVARASRKDLRNAVQGARRAFASWSTSSAYLRGQILYRMAEMLDHRSSAFVDALVHFEGCSAAVAKREVEVSATRLLFYAGCCDKLTQLLGTVNPVAGPYFNFSMPEASGVIAALTPSRPSLLGLVSSLAPILVPGNTVVCVVPTQAAPIALDFAEVIATSDVPPGVVQILSGEREELVPHVATHRDLDGCLLCVEDAAIDADTRHRERQLVEAEAADHVKRVHVAEAVTSKDWLEGRAQGLGWILPFVEIKTAWHSMGR
ncbi:MAG TPA: aldehyde dehydrogenase family protein [Planctomycetota bacterium]|nr:aldehyde dehydrogenase family protein [Planctomycetota bacterium]